MTKDIEAAQKAFKKILDQGYAADKCLIFNSMHVPYADLQVISDALDSQCVDVEEIFENYIKKSGMENIGYSLNKYNPDYARLDQKYMNPTVHNMWLMLKDIKEQGYLKTPEPKTEVDVKEMWEQLDHFWRWIERAHFDDSLSVDECLGVLVHSPYAPWNSDREKWDTSHKDYDAKIDAVVEASKNKPAEPLQPIEGNEAMSAFVRLANKIPQYYGTQDQKDVDTVRQALSDSQDHIVQDHEMVDGKYAMSKEWCMEKAKAENGHEVGAGFETLPTPPKSKGGE